MARHTFGGQMTDFLYRVVDGTPAGLPGVSLLALAGVVGVQFYDQPTGGTRLTDLLDSNGQAAAGISSGSDSFLPIFSGPDDGGGQDYPAMWADANGGNGPRRLIVANDLAPAVTAAVVAAANAQATAAQINPSSFVPASALGTAGGVATLDGNGRLVQRGTGSKVTAGSTPPTSDRQVGDVFVGPAQQ